VRTMAAALVAAGGMLTGGAWAVVAPPPKSAGVACNSSAARFNCAPNGPAGSQTVRLKHGEHA
jgi:hypothetical protein